MITTTGSSGIFFSVFGGNPRNLEARIGEGAAASSRRGELTD
jgi:hypothetical protein